MAIHRWSVLLAGALVAVACRKADELTFEQFVQTTVELRQAADQTTSPEAFAARKRAIEARHHVTDAELKRYVQQHAHDVKLLSAAWDSIEARVQRSGTRDAATRPTPAPAAPTPGPRPTAQPAPPAGPPGAGQPAPPTTTPATTTRATSPRIRF